MIKYHSHRKRKSYALAVILILLAILLLLTSPLYFRPVISSIIYPFQFVTQSIWKGITGVPSFFIHLANLSRENTALRQELESLIPKRMLFDELSKENDRLRAVLAFRKTNPYSFNLLPAQVIAKGPTPWNTILEINQGSKSGIKLNMPVIAKNGLAGKVVEVSFFSSKIMLLSDAESAIASIDVRSRDFGVVEGAPPKTLFMRYVSAGATVKVGDLITTSNISTLFPPGIPIGTVSHVSKREHDLFYHIEIKSAVDFSKIEDVFVIL